MSPMASYQGGVGCRLFASRMVAVCLTRCGRKSKRPMMEVVELTDRRV